MSPHPPAPTSDESLPAKTRGDRRDWGIIVIVASLLLMLALYLSYQPNPWVATLGSVTDVVYMQFNDGLLVPISIGEHPTVNGAKKPDTNACDVHVQVDSDLWGSRPRKESLTVNETATILMDRHPMLASPKTKLRPVSLSRWKLFDARRIGPRLAKLIEPALRNDYWEAPFDVTAWFGYDALTTEYFYVACTDEKQLPTMKLEPGDYICFTKE